MSIELIGVDPDSQLVLFGQLVTDRHPESEIFPRLVGCHHAHKELIWSNRDRLRKHCQSAKHLPKLFPARIENRRVDSMREIPQTSVVACGYTE